MIKIETKSVLFRLREDVDAGMEVYKSITRMSKSAIAEIAIREFLDSKNIVLGQPRAD
jgi:hypothetical protein